MSFAERNKRIVSDLIVRCSNSHNLSVVHEFTTNRRAVESQTSVLESFTDLWVEVLWTVAEDNKVVSWQHMHGTHLGPWMFAPIPTGRTIDTNAVVASEFDGLEISRTDLPPSPGLGAVLVESYYVEGVEEPDDQPADGPPWPPPWAT